MPSPSFRNRPLSPLVVSLFLLLPLLGGCQTEEDRLQAIAAQAKTAGRAAASTALTQAWQDGRVTFDGALTYAHGRLEAGEDVTEFAGAVLDTASANAREFQSGDEFEIFWMRVGRLAFAASLRAYEAGRLEEARSLVLAGPPRWQRESYWLRYPDHDALAAVILARTGDRTEAVQRLRSRSILTGDAEEALAVIQRMPVPPGGP